MDEHSKRMSSFHKKASDYHQHMQKRYQDLGKLEKDMQRMRTEMQEVRVETEDGGVHRIMRAMRISETPSRRRAPPSSGIGNTGRMASRRDATKQDQVRFLCLVKSKSFLTGRRANVVALLTKLLFRNVTIQ